MSHWVKQKAKIDSLELIEKALKSADIPYEKGDLKITSEFSSQTHQVDLKIHESIGIKKTEDGFEIMGDFYKTKFPSKGNLIKELVARAEMIKFVENAQEHGFNFDNPVIDEITGTPVTFNWEKIYET